MSITDKDTHGKALGAKFITLRQRRAFHAGRAIERQRNAWKGHDIGDPTAFFQAEQRLAFIAERMLLTPDNGRQFRQFQQGATCQRRIVLGSWRSDDQLENCGIHGEAIRVEVA